MCEYCDKSEVIVEKLDSDEQFPCEWISEEEGPGTCDQQAAYAVSEWYVEDHLCDVHKENTEKEMEEGLADFLSRRRIRFPIRNPSDQTGRDLPIHHALRNGLENRAGKRRATLNMYSRNGWSARNTPPRWDTNRSGHDAVPISEVIDEL